MVAAAYKGEVSGRNAVSPLTDFIIDYFMPSKQFKYDLSQCFIIINRP